MERCSNEGRLWRFVTICAVGLLSAGCGRAERHGWVKHDEKLVEVRGTVLVEGKPADRAAVFFHRVTADGSAVASSPVSGNTTADRKPNPRGECDDSGEFRLSTYNALDGAPPGKYLVTVSWTKESSREDAEPAPELLPARYQDVSASGLSVEIGDEPPQTISLQLTSNP